MQRSTGPLVFDREYLYWLAGDQRPPRPSLCRPTQLNRSLSDVRWPDRRMPCASPNHTTISRSVPESRTPGARRNLVQRKELGYREYHNRPCRPRGDASLAVALLVRPCSSWEDLLLYVTAFREIEVLVARGPRCRVVAGLRRLTAPCRMRIRLTCRSRAVMPSGS